MATKQIIIVCAGISKTNMNRLIERLKHLQSAALHPLLVSVMLTTSTVEYIRYINYDAYHEYRAIMRAMDCDKSYTYDYKYHEAPAFSERPQRLTQLTKTIVDGEHSAGILTQILDHIEVLLKKLGDNNSAFPSSVGIELQEELVFTRLRLLSMQQWYRYLKDGTQTLIQLVYATLQQEDNKVNHRYGADMRLITAITLIFLPATFVATFFSSTFWDFAPSNTGAKVSGWLWIYWVVTVVLTLMVLVVWRFFHVLVRVLERVRGLGVVQPVGSTSMLKKFPRWREKKMRVDEEVGEKTA
ncbi:hypothetical protein N0V83_000843 [Neocucurbitaria cava]|uniref:Uncharacterized protein n=1 Tax=Neocucurbitaria cava TaxID=798079 RepID=A0A9W8YJE1_9PLEO|nr:hypothetical protein N0V83_000843 [Neocucurbitaria cava]